jgi:hypothetical protein
MVRFRKDQSALGGACPLKSPSAETLLKMMDWNSGIIRMQTKEISQAESLIQPPFQGNCLNWVVGHLLTSRDTILTLMKLEPVLSPAEMAIYDRGTKPLIDPQAAFELPALLEKIKISEERIREGILQLSDDDLDEATTFGSSNGALGRHIFFLLWHETYHVGQLELLRQLAGKNDKVI